MTNEYITYPECHSCCHLCLLMWSATCTAGVPACRSPCSNICLSSPLNVCLSSMLNWVAHNNNVAHNNVAHIALTSKSLLRRRLMSNTHKQQLVIADPVSLSKMLLSNSINVLRLISVKLPGVVNVCCPAVCLLCLLIWELSRTYWLCGASPM
jgi:hypothetical protein